MKTTPLAFVLIWLLAGAVPGLAEPSQDGEVVLKFRHDDPKLAELVKALGVEDLDGKRRVVVEIELPDMGGDGGNRGRAAARATAPMYSREALAGLRYSGKEGHDKNLVHGSTRAGNVPDLKLVGLAPGDEGVTVRAKPRLWWHQSAESRQEELEFILTKLVDRRPVELLRIPLAAMPAGYNSIDLGNPTINPGSIENPEGVSLDPGNQYQWTLSLRGISTGSAVFAKVRRVADEALERQVKDARFEETTLEALAAAGNWYELFDAVALLARTHPADDATLAARRRLLENAGVQEHVHSP